MRLNIKIEQSERGDYRGHCPSLPGCIVRAPNPLEARKKLEDAVVGYLASLDLATVDNQPELQAV